MLSNSMSEEDLIIESEHLSSVGRGFPASDRKSSSAEDASLLLGKLQKVPGQDSIEGCYKDDDCFPDDKENDEHLSQLKQQEKNLYPNVLISPSRDHSDIDTDEEDFQMRSTTSHKRNDSGQGSSITDSNVSTIQSELKRLELNDEETPSCDFGGIVANDVSVEFPQKTVDTPSSLSESSTLKSVDLDTDVTEILRDAKNVLPKPRASSVINVSSPVTDVASSSFDDNDFTDIPLDSPGNKQNLNTFAPRLRSGSQGGNVSSEGSDGLHKPNVTDTKPKSGFRLFRKDSNKSWKLFGNQPVRVPTTPTEDKPMKLISKAKKPVVASSTTALILENRPSNLPPKSAKEELHHKQLYEEMLKGAKKKEMEDLKKEQNLKKQQHNQEKEIVSIQRIWKEEIINNWDTVKNTKKVKDLWWNGLPSSVRGKVWRLAIGNDLHITPELFQILQAHAVEKLLSQKYQDPIATLHDSESSLVVSKENTVGLISLDVARTFPALCIFQKGGPYFESLRNLLGAYTCYRPDVGYVQGMSFIAAMLLLNMDTVDAFTCFSNLMHKPCQMAFFTVNQPMMEAYFQAFDVMLEECAPRIHRHFVMQKLSHDIYLIDWIFTLFSKSLPLDVASRVWDMFSRDGEDFLFRTALGILTLYQDMICTLDFFHLAQYITKISGDVQGDKLFQSIAALNFNRQKFQQVLAFYKNRIPECATR